MSADDQLRIGGEFELGLSHLLAPPGARPPSWGRGNELWVDTGRAGLWIAGREILRNGGAKRVWLPAYACESILEPFAQLGFETVYYPVGDRLQDGGAPLPMPRRTETLLFIHYFGHRNRAMERHAAELRDRGVWVIEDCVQAGLSDGVGRLGHFAVASYRKLLSIPDGALLGTDERLQVELADADECFVSQRLLGKVLRGAEAAAETFLPLLERSEQSLGGPVVARRLSWLSRHLMARTDLQAVVTRRCANWHELCARLVPAAHSGWLEPLFDSLAPGDVPLGMPIRVVDGKRDALKSYLAAHNIFCPVHWPLEHVPRDARFAAEHALASSILTLPIDQRMSTRHVDRLTELLEEFTGVAP